MGDKFKLCIVESEYNFLELENIIKKYCISQSDIGPMKQDFEKNKFGDLRYINYRKIILIKDYIFRLLIENMEKEEILIREFQIKNSHKSPKDSVMHFYFPENERKNKNRVSILNRFLYLSEIGIINTDQYFVHTNVVEFSETFDSENRALIKILLDERNCRVSWCKRFAFKKIDKFFV